MRRSPPLIYVDPRVAAGMAQEPGDVLGRGDAGPVAYVRKDEVDRRLADVRRALAASDRVVNISSASIDGVSRLYALTASGRIWELTELGWQPFPAPGPSQEENIEKNL